MCKNELNAEQWQAIAEKLAEYLDKMCDAYLDNCDTCPLYNCEMSLGSIKQFVIRKAKKELGYE